VPRQVEHLDRPLPDGRPLEDLLDLDRLDEGRLGAVEVADRLLQRLDRRVVVHARHRSADPAHRHVGPERPHVGQVPGAGNAPESTSSTRTPATLAMRRTIPGPMHFGRHA